MDSLEPRHIAMIDQINAHHRDAMIAYRRFRDILKEMGSADIQIAAVSDMPAMHREILAGQAAEEGDYWLVSLLNFDGAW